MAQLLWDLGTAYDLFVSLDVLHFPAKYKVPGAWTAGMRARLASADREILEQSQLLVHVPLHWIYSLPTPKDGAAALWTLGQVLPAKRLPLLALGPDLHPVNVAEILEHTSRAGTWDEKDLDTVLVYYQRQCEMRKIPVPAYTELMTILNWWTRAEDFGVRYLDALRHYHAVFFEEEEHRIRSSLETSLARAQDLAQHLALPDLLEDLSQGLRLVDPIKTSELVLAPSYWSTPLVFMGETNAGQNIWLYGARTPTASLVPGEMVPDTMLRELEALSDPTRLRILQYLSAESLGPAQLAKRLRLRTPTVMHHLQILRLAGLVQLTLGGAKENRTYATRPGAVAAIFSSVQTFLQRGATENPDLPGNSEISERKYQIRNTRIEKVNS